MPIDTAKNRKRVIDAIRDERLAQFDMEHWVTLPATCGTAACLGGHADLLMHKDAGIEEWSDKTFPVSEILSWLGVSPRSWHWVFDLGTNPNNDPDRAELLLELAAQGKSRDEALAIVDG